MIDPLSLQGLRSFDPGASVHDRESRFCCPVCGGNRPRDTSHRSLSVNVATGLFICHRCGAKGRLGQVSAEAGRLPPPKPAVAWRDRLVELRPIAGTPGDGYLRRRGIPTELATRAAVVYSHRWYGRPAVLFPFTGRTGRLVAAQGRCIDQREPGKLSAGRIGLGVFSTPGALSSELIVITEAPVDALSLAAAGLPSIALAGTEGKPWLRDACRGRRALLALDADVAGDIGSVKLAALLAGTRCRRLRPEGAKDRNELLCRSGLPALRRFVAAEVVDGEKSYDY